MGRSNLCLSHLSSEEASKGNLYPIVTQRMLNCRVDRSLGSCKSQGGHRSLGGCKSLGHESGSVRGQLDRSLGLFKSRGGYRSLGGSREGTRAWEGQEPGRVQDRGGDRSLRGCKSLGQESGSMRGQLDRSL